MLEPEVEQYYNSYFELFMQEGWEQFMTDVQQAVDTIQILAIQDAKELHLAQGQLQVFQRLLTWQDSITNTYEAALEEANYTEESDA
jgi:FtsZ-binding cell division protein ZapB